MHVNAEIVKLNCHNLEAMGGIRKDGFQHLFSRFQLLNKILLSSL